MICSLFGNTQVLYYAKKNIKLNYSKEYIFMIY